MGGEPVTRACATLTANPSLDQTSRVDRVEPGYKLRCSRPTNEPGGGGINVSRAAHELGLAAPAVWACGGRVGLLLGELLDADDVPHRPVHMDGMVRQNLTIEEESTGRQYRFAMPGPPLGPDAAGRLLTTLQSLEPRPELLVASGSLPPGFDESFYGRLARTASAGTDILLDAAGAGLGHALDVGVYLVKLNERELGAYLQRHVEGSTACAEAAQEILDSGGARCVVVSRAANGAVAVDRDGPREVQAPPVEVASNVGAGDSMLAGLLVGMAEERDLDESLRIGVAAGTAAATTPGTGLCRRTDVDALMDRIPAAVAVAR